ncbi:MAG: RDD family protein, partial [Pelistega sp.]|nr:RDD family protein [Pelistega sp.]
SFTHFQDRFNVCSTDAYVPDANKSSQDNFGMQFGDDSTSDVNIVNQESASLQFGGGSTPDAKKANQDNANMQHNKNPLGKPPYHSTHPWRRFFARLVDTWVFLLLAFFIISLLGQIILSISSDKSTALIKFILLLTTFLLFIALAFIIIESIFLSCFGTTPAKYCFGIKVLAADGQKLKFSTSLKRTFYMLFFGCALNLPLLPIITQILSYFRLKNKGITLWDEKTGAVVTHKKWGVIRAILCISITLLSLFILYAITKIPDIISHLPKH